LQFFGWQCGRKKKEFAKNRRIRLLNAVSPKAERISMKRGNFRRSWPWLLASCVLPVLPAAAAGGNPAAPNFEDPSFVPAPPQEAGPAAPNAFSILFVGNSITRHGIVLTPLKWDHVAGMAASREEKDYAHRLGALIQGTMPERKVELRFENVNERLLAKGAPVSFGTLPPPHLVVIQTGEHEGPGKSKQAVAEVYEAALIKPYYDLSPRPLIVCVGIWAPSNGEPYGGWVRDINDAYQEVCAKYRIPFVSVEGLAKDPGCRGWGEHPGVKWHPNDQGMEGYATLLFDAYRRQGGAPPSAAVPAPVDATSNHLVSNGSFEQELLVEGKPAPAGSWEFFGFDKTRAMAGAYATDGGPRAHSGKRAVSITIPKDTADATANGMWLSGWIEVRPGTAYAVEAWIKTSACTGKGAWLWMLGYAEKNGAVRGPGKITQPLQFFSGTQDWREWPASILIAREVHWLRIACRLDGAGTASFDDVTVLKME
jgi:hypothetical protein